MTRVAAEEVQPATGDAPRRERRSSGGAAVRNPRTAGKSRSGMLPIGRPSGDRPPLGGDTVRMRTIWECFYPGATPARRRSAPDVLKVDGDGVPGVGGDLEQQRAVKYYFVVLGDGVNGCRQREHALTNLSQ